MFGAWATSDDTLENTRRLVAALGDRRANETIKARLKRANRVEIVAAMKQIVSRIYFFVHHFQTHDTFVGNDALWRSIWNFYAARTRF